jgi:hypothetical protein
LSIIQRLPDGPLDIIGDVHGEYEVLEQLLERLGYDANGNNAGGRHLVFLGDLIDRGPDSPAVVEKVMQLVDNGVAQCILGNHELLLLLGRAIPGNGWFIQPNPHEVPGEFHSVRVDPDKMDTYLDFFASLPILLENPSIRVAHACWHAPSVGQIRSDARLKLSIADLYRHYEVDVRKRLNNAELAHMIDQEKTFYAVALHDPDWEADILPAHAEAEIIARMTNPIRVVTSGTVEVAEKPFFSMGQWQMFYRSQWWNTYSDEIPVIIGHFWRRFDTAVNNVSGVFGKDVFEGIPSHAWMGANNNVYCVDYSVGQRHVERSLPQRPGKFYGKLAALRWPEREVIHDDGTVVPVATGQAENRVTR